MSTVIDHGYRLTPGTDPFAFIARVREVMDPARDREDAKLLAGLYAEAIDQTWFKGEPIGERAGVGAWRQWYDEQAKMGKMERRHDPNGFGIQIGHDTVTDSFVLLVLIENRDLRDVFDDMDDIEEYGYWNNSNGPDDVPEAEWQTRKEVWDRIIPWSGRSNMLDFTLRPPYDSGPRRLLGLDGEDTTPVFAALPTAEERALNVGGNAYTSYLHNEHGIEPWTAAQHVVFGRSKNLRLVVDVVKPYLPAITPELVTEGSHGATVDTGYPAALKAACEELYALDKEKLASR